MAVAVSSYRCYRLFQQAEVRRHVFRFGHVTLSIKPITDYYYVWCNTQRTDTDNFLTLYSLNESTI